MGAGGNAVQNYVGLDFGADVPRKRHCFKPPRGAMIRCEVALYTSTTDGGPRWGL